MKEVISLSIRNSLLNQKTETDFVYETLKPHVELNGSKICTIEGSKGIIEYDSNCVRINCSNVIIKISGENLCLDALMTERVCVSGNIFAIELCN